VHVQAVLPGATATEFWAKGGLPVENLPASIVVSADKLVEAALVGFDRKEPVTIPSLHAAEEWDNYEAGRRAMAPHLSNSAPAQRYLTTQ
jgi:short-subunit dehydrogenase